MKDHLHKGFENTESTRPDIPGLSENPFRVPDGYFEALPGRIRDRITMEQNQDNIRPISRRLFFRVAATIVLAVAVGWVLSMFLLPSRTVEEQTVSALDYLEQEVAAYTLSDDDEIMVSVTAAAEEQAMAEDAGTESTLFYYAGSGSGSGINDTIAHEDILEYLEEAYSYTDLLTDL
jgi:hypothetical protein